jgi:hypothetical protein
MPEQATIYENYRNVDETTWKPRRAATGLEYFYPLTETEQIWRKQRCAPQNSVFYTGEFIPELSTGMEEYFFTAAVTEVGSTYVSAGSIPLAVACYPEQEIEVVVRMSPKTVRNATVRITARNKGIPNPIL